MHNSKHVPAIYDPQNHGRLGTIHFPRALFHRRWQPIFHIISKCTATLPCQISCDLVIDPDSILTAAMADGKFVYVEDNQVEYYEAHRDNQRTK
jgi:hypothetical protein